METKKKFIDAYIVRIIKRGNVIDTDYTPNDVNHITYLEHENGTYDVSYYDYGNCTHKEYSVTKDSLNSRFHEWKASPHCAHTFSKYKMLSYEIKYI
jgi:hypothetical protein